MTTDRFHGIRKYLLIVLVALSVAVAGTGVASAAGKDKSTRSERKTRKTAAIREKVYRKLAEAQEKADAEQFAEALSLLGEVKKMKKLSPYETAQLWNFYGFIYYSQDKLDQSIGAYEQVLKQQDIPDAMRSSVTYTLAQLWYQKEKYRTTIELINKWLKTAENPGPGPYELLATCYYQLEQYKSMIDPINRAMEIARARGKPVKENWWLLLRVAYYELNDYKKVRDILEVLVVNWPKKEYWTQLSATYGELDIESRQLAAYVSAYDQGLLNRSAELVQLAQLYLQANVPYKAAKVLEKGFADGIVEKKSSNYRLLSQAWQLAQNDLKAIPALKTAAKMEEDGELDARLAQSYLNLSMYDECIKAAKSGLRKGGLKHEDQAQIILGTCYVELEKFKDARAAFKRAAKTKASAKNARQWLRYIEREEDRQRKLAESLKQVRS